MEVAKRFRLMAVRIALVLILIVAGCTFAVSQPLAKGLVFGGLSGVIAFWATALRLEKLALRGLDRVKWRTQFWNLGMLALYGVALCWGYSLDKERLTGFAGAACGLFIIRIVVFILALTGLDLKREGQIHGRHR